MSKRCGAKTRSGEPCNSWALLNGRCRMHGGKHPRGLASPHYKHGRYSKHLPARLASRYQEAQTDTELLALREDIALLDARLADVLSRVDTGESGWLWQKLKDTSVELAIARREQDTERIGDVINEQQRLINAGHQDYAAWGDVRTLLEQRRRLVESERKRLTEMQQTLTVERAMLLIGAVAGIVKAHVSDRKTLAAISADLGALLDHQPATVVDAE